MKKICILTILFLVALAAWSQDYDLDIDIDLTETFESEEAAVPFSLYGYLVNFSSVNFYTGRSGIENMDMGNTFYMRLKGDFEPEEALHFHFEASYSSSMGNHSFSALYESYAMDHLWGSVAIGLFDLQFGKMPIAWGTGYVFNPSSRTASSAYMETVSEETPGTLGIVPSVQLAPGFAIQSYLAFQDSTSPLKEWEARLVNLGKSVRVRTFEGIVEGVAEAVDATGALLVRRADGHLIQLLEGDITLGPSRRTG